MTVSQDFKSVGFCEAGMQRAYGLLQAAVDSGELLGAVLQVSRSGTPLPVACFGKRQLAQDGAAVVEDTIFLADVHIEQVDGDIFYTARPVYPEKTM